MKGVFKAIFAMISIIAHPVYALQFLLNSPDPVCINVTPTTFDKGIEVTYSVTGTDPD